MIGICHRKGEQANKDSAHIRTISIHTVYKHETARRAREEVGEGTRQNELKMNAFVSTRPSERKATNIAIQNTKVETIREREKEENQWQKGTLDAD